ncbi:TPA: ATP-binding protein [Legionella pneumophila]|nr:ATP-binding protein [Legionella pneumophila]
MSNFVAEIISKSSVLKIGTVISVEGRTIRVLVDREKNTSHLFYKGELVKSIVVGSYVKITKGFEELVGKIEGEYIEEDIFQSKKNYKSDIAKIRRILIISLLGYLNVTSFERGIKELPLIDNECFLLDEIEFNKVHHFIKNGDVPIRIGQLAQERGMPISLGVNGLFASHIGIFGNTGSGKSYTLANLYHTLFQHYKDKAGFKKNASFFLIDFNGEYIQDNKNDDNIIVEPLYKNTYNLSTQSKNGKDKFPIPGRVIQEPLLWTVLLEATEKTQKPFIRNALESRYIDQQLTSTDTFKNFIRTIIIGITKNKDKTLEKALVINFLKDLQECSSLFTGLTSTINFFEQHLKYHNKNSEYYFDNGGIPTYSSNDNFDNLIDRAISNIQVPILEINAIEKIRLKIISCYYNDVVRGYSNKEHISPLISRLKTRIPDLVKVITIEDDDRVKTKNLTIVSMKNLNIHMRKILPLLFCKYLYDEKKSANKNQNKFLNIIIDEAHNIMSESSQRESEQWKDYRLETFEEIIKEGRKFGVFLTIASQRPSDISSTIISQLHNYFLHRLINNNDIKAIERTVSYLDKVSFESLPILPTGTCILAGLIAQVPVVIEINKISDQYKPFNQTIEPTKHWG